MKGFALSVNARLSLKDQWQDIETEVLDELRHRVADLLAIRAATEIIRQLCLAGTLQRYR